MIDLLLRGWRTDLAGSAKKPVFKASGEIHAEVLKWWCCCRLWLGALHKDVVVVENLSLIHI